MVQHTRTTALASFVVASTLVGNSFAFTATHQKRSLVATRTPTHIASSRYDSTQRSNSSPDDDVEAVRRKLEHLVQEDTTEAQRQVQSHHDQTNNNDNRHNHHHKSPAPTTPPKEDKSPSFNFFSLLFGGSRAEDEAKEKAEKKQELPAVSARRQQHHRQQQRDTAMEIDLSVLDYPLRQYLSLHSHRNSGFAPMTAAEMDRRQAELHLLSRLVDKDEEVTDNLVRLWFLEGGLEGAIRLQEVEHLMSSSNNPQQSGHSDSSLQNPNNYNPEDNQPIQGNLAEPGNNASPSRNNKNWEYESERILLELIQDHGRAWPEPIYRLATLYYMQGKLQDAKQLCRLVLSIKPWHFGALSSLVMVYASLHQTALARQWAAKRLPSLSKATDRDGAVHTSSNRRRQLWVQIAAEQAAEQLQEKLQERNEWWGPIDSHHSRNQDADGAALFRPLPSFADLDKIIQQTLENEMGNSGVNNNDNVWQ